MPMYATKSFTMLVLALISLTFADEDSYHQALRTQLQTEFGVTGGEWMLSDAENSTNAKASLTNVSRKTITWEGDEPFTQVLELKTSRRQNNPWENAVRFNTGSAIKRGDVLLLVIWMNSIESDDTVNHITHIFELTSSPYTKSLDQSGDIKAGWRQWMLPFTAEMDYAAGQARYQLNMGYMAGTIQIAGLAVINYGAKYTVDDLPMSKHHLDYIGREDDAQWRIEALERIERFRKGELQIKVVNRNGDPIKNAAVSAEMVQHEFGFGTAISTRWWLHNLPDSDDYLARMEDLTGDGRSFNIAVFENALKWPAWENNNYLGTPDQVARVVDWLKSNGMRVRGHNLVWPKWRHLPDDLQTHRNDPGWIENRIRRHIAEEAGWDGIKGMIDEWDVINEMVHCTDLRNVFGTEDIYADWLKWTAEADSDAALFLNEYSIISGGGNDVNSQTRFKEILQRLIDLEAPLHGIGIQGHMNSDFTPPAKVVQILQDFSSFGLDIDITEYDASGAEEDIAADYMRDILIAAFSVPQVRNFLMWGFWDGAHWHNDAPIFRRDWSLKPSGEAFIEWVFNRWWTNTSGETSRDGIFSTRAFYGLYDVTAEYGGVQTYRAVQFTHDAGEVTLQIDTDLTSVASPSAPDEFELRGVYPNPFNPKTTIVYSLPRRVHVIIEIFDIRGRRIARLIDEEKDAGRHAAEFDGGEQKSGVYYVRMTSENFQAFHKMLLIK